VGAFGGGWRHRGSRATGVPSGALFALWGADSTVFAEKTGQKPLQEGYIQAICGR
jgi:hypothetical protein